MIGSYAAVVLRRKMKEKTKMKTLLILTLLPLTAFAETCRIDLLFKNESIHKVVTVPFDEEIAKRALPKGYNCNALSRTDGKSEIRCKNSDGIESVVVILPSQFNSLHLFSEKLGDTAIGLDCRRSE